MNECQFKDLCGNYREDNALCLRKIPRCNQEEFGKAVRNRTLVEVEQGVDVRMDYDAIMGHVDSLKLPLAPVPTPATGQKKGESR